MSVSLDYKGFESKHGYIEYLERNGLITHGCALCMLEYGVCEEAVTKLTSPDETFIDCIPFSHIDTNSFPISCLIEWYGDEYLENCCEDCA